jgi:hypothetical protein
MSTRPFLDTLRSEVARMQAAHPEREGELARAHALILHGMVVPSPEDPTTGQVLSSDGHKVYHVNGTCSCDAGQHGRGCKHVHGWRLYQYVERKLAAQASQTAEEPSSPPQTPIDTPAAVDASTALPEAPASANVRVTIAGREVQITLRDTSEARLLARLQTVLTRFPVPEKSTAADQREGFCAVHGVQMRQTTKNGRTWWSHKTAEGWCKGRRGRA